MRLLFLGDVVGRSGRQAIAKYLPDVKSKLKPDAIIVNAENSAHGFGLTPTICNELFGYGVDIITCGNHTWDRKEIIPFLDANHRVIRPINYPEGTPGVGHTKLCLPNGQKLAVVQVMGQTFMGFGFASPFGAIKKYLQTENLGVTADVIFVDFHANCTAEKTAFARYCDGRVTAVVGTHTHIPTADAYIQTGGTAYQTDAGMCGDYDSVIGFKDKESLGRFLTNRRQNALEVADGAATFCGLYLETNKQGLTDRCEMIRLGGRLSSQFPEL